VVGFCQLKIAIGSVGNSRPQIFFPRWYVECRYNVEFVKSVWAPNSYFFTLHLFKRPFRHGRIREPPSLELATCFAAMLLISDDPLAYCFSWLSINYQAFNEISGSELVWNSFLTICAVCKRWERILRTNRLAWDPNNRLLLPVDLFSADKCITLAHCTYLQAVSIDSINKSKMKMVESLIAQLDHCRFLSDITLSIDFIMDIGSVLLNYSTVNSHWLRTIKLVSCTSWTAIQTNFFDTLSNFHQLRRLELQGFSLEGDDFEPLNRYIPDLDTLILRNCQSLSSKSRFVDPHSKVRTILLNDVNTSVSQFSSLFIVEMLQRLTIFDQKNHWESLISIAITLDNLTHLSIWRSNITDPVLEKVIRSCQRITKFEMFLCQNITGNGIYSVFNLNKEHLNLLALDSMPITREFVQDLSSAGFVNLEYLCLCPLSRSINNALTLKDIEGLKVLKSLKLLLIEYIQIAFCPVDELPGGYKESATFTPDEGLADVVSWVNTKSLDPIKAEAKFAHIYQGKTRFHFKQVLLSLD
jgi:hypothetical protein